MECAEVIGRSATLVPVELNRDPALKELATGSDNKEKKTLGNAGLCEEMKMGLCSREGLRRKASLRPRQRG